MGFPNDAPPAYNGSANCQDPNAIGGSSSASVNAPPDAMTSSSSSSVAQNGGRSQSPPFHPITYSASCPSFTALYELPTDDLMGDFSSNGGRPSTHNNYSSNSGSFVGPPANSFASELDQSPPTSGPAPLATYEELLEFQQQHHRASLRQFPHHHQPHMHDHLAVLRQSRRQLHASASFTSLSSMETEYRRQSGNKQHERTAACSAPSHSESLLCTTASKRKKRTNRWFLQPHTRHKSCECFFSSALSVDGCRSDASLSLSHAPQSTAQAPRQLSMSPWSSTRSRPTAPKWTPPRSATSWTSA